MKENPTNQPSETTRTDKVDATGSIFDLVNGYRMMIVHARTLEKELNQAKKELADLKERFKLSP